MPLTINKGELDSGQIFVSLTVDEVDMEFLLDSGSSSTILKIDKNSEKYKSDGIKEASGATGAIIKCDLVKTKKITSSDKVIAENKLMLRCPTYTHNTFGRDLIQNKSVKFDFFKKQLYLSEVPIELQNTLKQFDSGQLAIDVRIANKNQLAIWDTGVSLTTIDQKFIQQNENLFKLISSNQGMDGVGAEFPVKIYEITSITIDNLTFEKIKVIATDFTYLNKIFPDVSIFIGFNLISLVNWLFDFKNKSWQLEKI